VILPRQLFLLTSAIVSAVPLSFIYKLQTKASW